MHVVNMMDQRSEDVEIFDRGVLRKFDSIQSVTVNIERDGLIDELDIKQEQLEVEIDIENHVHPDVEHIKIEIEEIHNETKEMAGRNTIMEELFDVVKQEKLEPTENINGLESKGHSIDQYIPEKRRTLKETESPNTTTSTDVTASINKAAVMMEVSKNTSSCSNTATHRGNVSVDSDKECTTAGTDVGDSRGEHLTDDDWDDCGDMFYDKHLLIQHVVRHDTGKRNNIQKSDDGSAQKCQGFDKSGVVYDAERCNSEYDICQRMSTQSSALNTLSMNTKEKPFECTICQRRFTVKSSLNAHLTIHTNNKPFQCTICQQTFTVKGSLNKHLRIHNNEKPYECSICQRRFAENWCLNLHLRTHTKEKPFECTICQRRFTQKGSLNAHLTIHSKEKPFECTICQQTFTVKGSLNKHLKIHTKEKPFECTTCERRFSEKWILKTHLRIHTNEKPFKCEVCEQRFTQKGNLNIHLKKHAKEKSFECAICKRRFTLKRSLDKHIRIHTKEKPFECSTCQRRFTERGHLTTHIRTHTKEKPFECATCQRRFSRKSALNVHLKTLHGAPRQDKTSSSQVVK